MKRFSEHDTASQAEDIIAAIETAIGFPWVGTRGTKGITVAGQFTKYAEPRYREDTQKYYVPAPDWAEKLEGIQVSTRRGNITVSRGAKVTIELDGTVKPVADVKGKVVP